MVLEKMFNPESVAIVGASRERKKLGHIIMKNILDSGFEGQVYPVNVNASMIMNHKVYARYEEIPEIPDLAVVVVPGHLVLGIMEEIAIKGTRNVVVISAGFKEVGEDGVDREAKLLDIVQKYSMRLLGPNCLGFVSNQVPINATFGMLSKSIGPMRFISQSGAIASAIIDWSDSIGLGFDSFVTLGNKADVNENDVLEYWLENDDDFDEDEQIEKGLSGYRPVAMYLESIVEGERFMKLLSRISKKQPTFVLKPGKSDGAISAMQSHTGSIAGADAVFDVAMSQSNVIRCDGMEDLFDLCRAFSWEKAPDGPEVAIISNAGGPAVLAADAVSANGLRLAKVTDRARRKMEEYLPMAASLHNPVDVLGDALSGRYEVAIREMLSVREVKSLVVILTPQVMTEIEETAKVVVKLSKEFDKPIVCAFMGGVAINEGESILDKYKIPNFRYVERALWVLGKMWKWNSIRKFETEKKNVDLSFSHEINNYVVQEINSFSESKFSSVPGYLVNRLMSGCGLEVPEMMTVGEISDALEFVKLNGYPVVLKLSSPKLLHKLEEGGVWLNIVNEEQLVQVYNEMHERMVIRQAQGDDQCEIIIQKQVSRGLELIVGLKRDNVFGPVMLFGAGGTWAEVLADRNLHVLPINRIEAEKLVRKSKIYKILAGFRSDSAYDLDKLYGLMVKLAQIMEMDERILDIEINPVILGYHEIWAVDGKMIIK